MYLFRQVRGPASFGKRDCVGDDILRGGKCLSESGFGVRRSGAEEVQEFISAGDDGEKSVFREVEPAFIFKFNLSHSCLCRL